MNKNKLKIIVIIMLIVLGISGCTVRKESKQLEEDLSTDQLEDLVTDTKKDIDNLDKDFEEPILEEL